MISVVKEAVIALRLQLGGNLAMSSENGIPKSSAHCSRPATILALQFAASSNHIAVCHHLVCRHCTARRQFSSARRRSKKRPQADRRQRTRAYRPMPSGAKLREMGWRHRAWRAASSWALWRVKNHEADMMAT